MTLKEEIDKLISTAEEKQQEAIENEPNVILKALHEVSPQMLAHSILYGDKDENNERSE